MAQALGDLMLRIGGNVDGLKGALGDAISALETAGNKANAAGNAISRAFDKLGVEDASAKVAAQAKSIQSSFDLLENAFKDGRIGAADYEKALSGLKNKLADLGKVKVEVPDFSAVNNALKGIGLSKTDFQISGQIEELKKNLDLLQKEMDEGRLSAKDYAAAQAQVKSEIDKLNGILPKIAPDLDKLDNALKSLGVTRTDFQVTREVEKLRQQLDYLWNEYNQGRLSAKDFAEAQKAVNREINALTTTVAPVLSTFDKLKANLGSLGSSLREVGLGLTATITAPIVGLATAAVKSASDLQSLEIGLRAVTKEAGPLSAQLERLKEVAKLPGLGFKEAVQGSINLQAAGFSAKTAERALSAFGNALATVGKGRADLDGVVTALAQIASKGKVSAEEINQLAERLPQIRVAIKSAFGEGIIDAKDFEKAGISAQQFIEKIITEFEKLPKATGGFKNEMENLKDAADQALSSIGKALIPFATQIVSALQPVAEFAQKAGEAFGKLPAPVQAAAGAFAALLAVVGPLLGGAGLLAGAANSIITLTSSIAGLAGGIGPLSAALGGVGGALSLATPLAIAFGAAIAGWAIYEAVTKLKAVNAELDRLYELQSRGVKATTKQAQEIRALEGALASYNKQIGVQKINVESAGKTVEQYVADLRKAVSGLDEFKGKQEQAATATKNGTINILEATRNYAGFGDASTKAAASTAKVAGAAESAGRGVKTVGEEFKRTAATTETFASAVMKAEAALIKANWEGAAKRVAALRVELAKLTDEEMNRRMSVEAPNITLPASTVPGLATDAAGAITNPTFPGNPDIGPDDLELDIKRTTEATDRLNKATKETKSIWTDVNREIAVAFDNIARGIATSIVEWKGLGDTVKSIFKSLATGILEIFTQALIAPLKAKMTEVLTGVLTNIPGLGGILGGGASAAGGAASAAGSIGGGASKGAGAAATGVSGALGVAGAVGGIASAISGVIGNFQMKAMNKSLDLIEKAARYTEAHALYILEKLNEYLPSLKDLHGLFLDYLGYFGSLMSTVEEIRDRAGMGSGEGAAAVTVEGAAFADLERATENVADVVSKSADRIIEALGKTPDQISSALMVARADAYNQGAADNAPRSTAINPALTVPPDSTMSVRQVSIEAGAPQIVSEIARLSDVMSGYWEKLFEALRSGIPGTVATTATEDTAVDQVNATENVEGAVTTGTRQTTNALTSLGESVTGAVRSTTAAVASLRTVLWGNPDDAPPMGLNPTDRNWGPEPKPQTGPTQAGLGVRRYEQPFNRDQLKGLGFDGEFLDQFVNASPFGAGGPFREWTDSIGGSTGALAALEESARSTAGTFAALNTDLLRNPLEGIVTRPQFTAAPPNRQQQPTTIVRTPVTLTLNGREIGSAVAEDLVFSGALMA
jgi:tape measure domain-containing protein